MKTCTEIYPDARVMPRLAVVKEAMWTPGQEITIGFINGDQYQVSTARYIMSVWMDYANVDMKFIEPGSPRIPMVRVAFNEGNGSWSYVGKQCLQVKNLFEPTMNFGWLNDETSDEEWDRVVLHETGHMLGAIHEHQSPAAGIKWNKKVVYEYYWNTQRWSKQQVDVNIFDRYGNDVSNTKFDPESIMLYPIPAEFTQNGFATGWNMDLSASDMDFMGELYPFGV